MNSLETRKESRQPPLSQFIRALAIANRQISTQRAVNPLKAIRKRSRFGTSGPVMPYPIEHSMQLSTGRAHVISSRGRKYIKA